MAKKKKLIDARVIGVSIPKDMLEKIDAIVATMECELGISIDRVAVIRMLIQKGIENYEQSIVR